MKIIRIISIIGLLICLNVPFLAMPRLMATRSEENGNRVTQELKDLAWESDQIVEIKESDLFWLDLHAENQTKENIHARKMWMIFSIISGALFLVILIKAKNNRTTIKP